MRVLIFHGYLLRGTGSNVYNANLAAALVELGHEVDLLAQERNPQELRFVGAVGDWDDGSLRVRRVRGEGATIYRPQIGPLLPVYVRDRYEGLQARPFPELSDPELERYVEANVGAVREVAARARPDAALANHLVMGPVILARALAGTGPGYAVVIHGSALEYTVKPHSRFVPFAREGLAPARGILVGSRHTAESLWTALEDPSLPPRTRLGPPGVDVHTFRPLPKPRARARLSALADALARRPSPRAAPTVRDSDFERDEREAARVLQAVAARPPAAPVVAFVGKLMLAKGIDLLLLAWPLVLARAPQATLVVAGFGSWRGGAERLLQALARSDLEAARTVLGAAPTAASFSLAFLARLEHSDRREPYLQAAQAMRERVLLSGRLEHEELAALLPRCEAIVVPSTFPEAFGMVAVEGAACGALPISAAHSGLAEVSWALAAELPPAARELVSFPLGDGAVAELAERLERCLGLPESVKPAVRAALARTVAERYSWQSVARGVLAAARGELKALALPRWEGV